MSFADDDALWQQRMAALKQWAQMPQQQVGVLGSAIGTGCVGISDKILSDWSSDYGIEQPLRRSNKKLSFRERLQKETDEWLKGILD